MKNIPVRQINTSTKEPPFTGRFSIRDIQTILNGKDLVQDLHRHDFYFLLALEKGAGEHIIDFTSYPVQNHSVFFLRPGQVHQLKLNKNSTGYLLEFDATFYSPKDNPHIHVLRKVSHKNHCNVETAQFNRLMQILSHIANEFAEKKEWYMKAIQSNLELFFIELARQSKNPNKITNENDQHQYAQERLEAFLDLLEKHIRTKKKVSQYASMLHLTSFQLNAVTKASLGKTSSALINEQLVMESKRLLLATSQQVNQVADLLGFEDPSYFIRFFKKHTGSSPDAFRRNFK